MIIDVPALVRAWRADEEPMRGWLATFAAALGTRPSNGLPRWQGPA